MKSEHPIGSPRGWGVIFEISPEFRLVCPVAVPLGDIASANKQARAELGDILDG